MKSRRSLSSFSVADNRIFIFIEKLGGWGENGSPTYQGTTDKIVCDLFLLFSESCNSKYLWILGCVIRSCPLILSLSMCLKISVSRLYYGGYLISSKHCTTLSHWTSEYLWRRSDLSKISVAPGHAFHRYEFAECSGSWEQKLQVGRRMMCLRNPVGYPYEDSNSVLIRIYLGVLRDGGRKKSHYIVVLPTAISWYKALNGQYPLFLFFCLPHPFSSCSDTNV